MSLVLCLELILRTSFFLVGIPGNILILLFFMFGRPRCSGGTRRTSYQVFISLIAIVDLVTCLFHEVMILLLALNEKDRSALGMFACRYVYFIPLISSDVSLWMLFWLSYDRFRRIARPLRKQITVFQAIIAFMLTVILILVNYVPYFGIHEFNTETRNCRNYREPKPIYKLITNCSYTFIIILPIIVIVVLYYKARNILHRQDAFVRSNSVTQQRNATRCRHYTAIKTLKTLTILMIFTGAFPRVSLLTQYAVTLYMTHLRETLLFYVLRCVVYNVLIINNVINVFVYFHRIREFRMFIVRDISGKRQCRSANNTSFIGSVQRRD